MKYILPVISFLFIAFLSEAQCDVISSFTPGSDTIVQPGAVIHFKSTSTNATQYEWSYEFGIPESTNPTFDMSFSGAGVYTVRLIAKNQNCSDTSYRKIIIQGSQPPGINYEAFYGQERTEENPKFIIPTADSGFLIGSLMINAYGTRPYYEDLYLVRINEKGCVLWSTRFTAPADYKVSVNKGVELSDGSFIITGLIIGSRVKNYTTRIDKNGNMLWQKNYDNTDKAAIYYFIKEIPGGIILSGTGINKTETAVLTKMDLQGNIIWKKTYSNTDYQYSSALEVMGDYAYMCSYVQTDPNQLTNDGLITKVNVQTGNTIWTKKYFNNANSNTSFIAHDLIKSGNLLLISFTDNNGLGYGYIDTSGVVTKSYTVQCNAPLNSWGRYKMMPMKNGDIIFSLTGREILPLQPYYSNHSIFARLNSQQQLLWSRDYRPFNRGVMNDFTIGSSQTVVGVGEEIGRIENYTEFDLNIKLFKVGADGDAPLCSVIVDYSVNAFPHQITTENTSWINEEKIMQNIVAAQLHPVAATTSYMYNCEPYYTGCSSLRVYGQSELCNLSKIYTFTARKGASCTNKVNFQTDPSAIKIVGTTDSTIDVMFLKTGKQMIRVWLDGNCSTLRDSLSIDVQDKQKNSFTLGNDFSLCPGASKKISAGKNYISYKWQDGSADSVFVAKDSGYYFVTVTDSCSYDYTDTIHVSLKTTIPVFIGNDMQICKGDTVSLQAPAGYLSYNWLPAYNLILQDSIHIAVFPQTDTSYSVTLKNNEGCTGADTIHIRVNSPIQFSLGTDTSFCNGNTLTLQAPPSFTNYTWNDGSNSTTYNASVTGTYYLQATDANGCLSSDTISIIVNANPDISLGLDKNICLDQTVRLGLTVTPPGVSIYKWQDGSQEREFTTGQLGTYYVQVWNNYLCSSTDTIQLLAYDPLPENFLPSYDSLCENESMQLTAPGMYAAYNWSNGSSTTTTIINAPGIYTLQVTDAKGCIGTDSISIYSKQCLHGIFIPSGFSPNGDGKNDLFKPVVKIELEKYHFIIYNRFGQKVFETSDPQKGWNGSFNGTPQPGNTVYVWSCQYQLQGQPLQIKKGTVTLIR